MTLRYRCLIVDHDDTAVDSTATIHYPAHVEVMRRIRPDHDVVDLDQWLLKNFDPGITAYFRDELRLTDEEIEMEFATWRRIVSERVPEFYPGFLELLDEYRCRGGVVAVVSHSDREIIQRDYLVAASGASLPDVIFGWDPDQERRKPSPYPVKEILKTYRVSPEEALVVDDLKPGVLMARAAGVHVAAAGWGHQIPGIREYMEKNCIRYLSTVSALRDFVLS